MSDNNVELKGLELLYYLMKRFNMSYNEGVNEMIKHNQDMGFINKIKPIINKHMLNNKHINLNNEGGDDVK